MAKVLPTTLLTTIITNQQQVVVAAQSQQEDIDEDFIGELKKSLSPPTDERPPIALPDAGQMTKEKRQVSLPPPTTVEALISLQNPQLRPSPDDILVIQIYDSPSQTQLLGGAKVSVAKIRFPIQVKLTSANANTSAWNDLASSQDLWIVASVCPQQSVCPGNDGTIFQASGISKFLTVLPGYDQESMKALGGSGIRLPATLPLKIVPSTM